MHGVNDLLIYCHLRISAIPWSLRITIIVHLKSPPPSCYKLNIDGSVSEGYMYASCIGRNSRGFFVDAFSHTLGWGISLDAEILAGLHGVIFAHSRNGIIFGLS